MMGAMCVDIQLAKMKEIWRDTREGHKTALDLESACLSQLACVSFREESSLNHFKLICKPEYLIWIVDFDGFCEEKLTQTEAGY